MRVSRDLDVRREGFKGQPVCAITSDPLGVTKVSGSQGDCGSGLAGIS